LEGADPRVVVEQNRDLIREFHFHGVVERQLDNGRTALQDHQAVDRGVFALEEALELLLADSFSGVLMIEVGRWEAAEASVRAVKAYLNKRINN
jgi:sugar phosphate isomerase/epimerase